MGYEMKLVRSFSMVEPQKLRLGLLAGCFLVSLTYFSMTQPFVLPIPTVNSQLSSTDPAPLSPLLGDSMNSQQFGGSENLTLESKLRCNVSDPNSGHCEQIDVVMREKNSTTTYEAPPPGGQEAKVALQFESNNKTMSVSSTHDDPKSTRYETPPSRGQDANTTQHLESNAKTAEREPASVDPRANLVNSSTTVTSSTQKVGTSYSGQLDGGRVVKKDKKPFCDVSDRRSDVCEMDGDVRIIGKNSTVLYVSNSQIGDPASNESWRIRPYARKSDGAAMASVRQVWLRSLDVKQEAPRCMVNHSVPAIVFSVAGYTGNYFHDFTDIIVPLFLNARQFNGEVQFVVANFRSWWINKYLPIFRKLSRYEIIDYDNDDRVHCFQHVAVGLRSHRDLTIDPSRSPNGYSMVDFTKFMRSSYSLERESPMRIREVKDKKPRLLIIARARTRRFTNLDKIVRMAEKLGYEVVVAESDGGNIAKFAHLVNSCDVMMGVHGAGLTNLVFLPTNAILIQIVPWGNLEWIAGNYFREPSKDMKLRYLEYSISQEESTLMQQYPRDDPVFTNPMSIHKLGWNGIKDIYLVKQSVKLNVRRFRRVLAKALKLLHQQ